MIYEAITIAILSIWLLGFFIGTLVERRRWLNRYK